MSNHSNGLRGLWFKWRSLRLPWRKQFLVGSDLAGNTYWEFKDVLTSNRLRRIVKYASPSASVADMQITPQWHQWLRHTRPEPPSITEQQADVQRQVQMQQLARLADERWASKPSFLDKPKEQPRPATAVKDPGGYVGKIEEESKEGMRNAVGDPVNQQQKSSQANDPWKQARTPSGPGEGWRPQAWDPSMNAPKR